MKRICQALFFSSTIMFSNLIADDKAPATITFDQGDDALPPSPAGFNAPANYTLKDSWDAYATLSYIYWKPGQKGMDLATSAALDSLGRVIATADGKTLFEGGQFSSGFKVGLGANVNPDQTRIFFQYTYFRQNKHVHSTAPTSAQGQGVWYTTSWFYQTVPGQQQALAASSISSKWHLSIDWLDMMLISSNYQSRRFLFSPFAGVRGSYIRQKLNLHAVAVNTNPSSEPVVSKNRSNTWGVGPRVGFETSWLIGSGFKFFGDLATEILYSQTTEHHSETAFSTLPGFYPLKLSIHNFQTVLFSTDAQMGFGWGTYLDNNRYHLNFDAVYEFNFLLGQNFMRNLIDVDVVGSGSAVGDLHLHGLTLNARFDF